MTRWKDAELWCLLAAAILTAPLGGGCAGGPRISNAPAPPGVSSGQLSLESQQVLGANLDASINATTQPAPTQLEEYFQSLLDRLNEGLSGGSAGMNFALKVIDGAEETRAFSTPSGSIYVFTGLLLGAADDAEVAAVLAHELGHVVLGHPIARLQRSLGRETVAALAVSQGNISRDPKLQDSLGRATAALLAPDQLVNLAEEEKDADARAIEYLGRSGYDRAAMASLLEAANKSRRRRLQDYVALHPSSATRIASLPQRRPARTRPGTALAGLKQLLVMKRSEPARLSAKKVEAKLDLDKAASDPAPN